MPNSLVLLCGGYAALLLISNLLVAIVWGFVAYVWSQHSMLVGGVLLSVVAGVVFVEYLSIRWQERAPCSRRHLICEIGAAFSHSLFAFGFFVWVCVISGPPGWWIIQGVIIMAILPVAILSSCRFVAASALLDPIERARARQFFEGERLW